MHVRRGDNPLEIILVVRARRPVAGAAITRGPTATGADINVERVEARLYASPRRKWFNCTKGNDHTYARRQLLRRRPRDPRVGNP